MALRHSSGLKCTEFHHARTLRMVVRSSKPGVPEDEGMKLSFSATLFLFAASASRLRAGGAARDSAQG
jgi:hypothetical protein